MKDRCGEFAALMGGRISGENRIEDDRLLDIHLDECEACRAELAALISLRGDITEAFEPLDEESPPAGLDARIISSLPLSSGPPSSPSSSGAGRKGGAKMIRLPIHPAWSFVGLAAAAAIILAMILVGSGNETIPPAGSTFDAPEIASLPEASSPQGAPSRTSPAPAAHTPAAHVPAVHVPASASAPAPTSATTPAPASSHATVPAPDPSPLDAATLASAEEMEILDEYGIEIPVDAEPELVEEGLLAAPGVDEVDEVTDAVVSEEEIAETMDEMDESLLAAADAWYGDLSVTESLDDLDDYEAEAVLEAIDELLNEKGVNDNA